MHELVLIERSPSYYKTWPSLEKTIPELSVETIVDKYQGFEGDLIDHFLVENDVADYKQKLDEFLRYKDLENCFLLHLISNQTLTPSQLQTQADSLGYDIGFCNGKNLAVYSSIFHEILFGHINELVTYKNLLNKELLFPSKEVAENYVRLHDEM